MPAIPHVMNAFLGNASVATRAFPNGCTMRMGAGAIFVIISNHAIVANRATPLYRLRHYSMVLTTPPLIGQRTI